MSGELPMDTLVIQRLAAQIDRDLAESRKLRLESEKLEAERRKLEAEGRKFERERGLAPWLVAAGCFGGVITLGQLLLRALGAMP